MTTQLDFPVGLEAARRDVIAAGQAVDEAIKRKNTQRIHAAERVFFQARKRQMLAEIAERERRAA